MERGANSSKLSNWNLSVQVGKQTQENWKCQSTVRTWESDSGKAQGKKWLGGRWVQKYCEWMSYYRWKWERIRNVLSANGETSYWSGSVKASRGIYLRQNSAVISREGLENQRNNMGGAEDREEDRQYHGWLAGQVREWMKKTSWWQWDGKREWVIYAEWSICEVKKCN